MPTADSIRQFTTTLTMAMPVLCLAAFGLSWAMTPRDRRHLVGTYVVVGFLCGTIGLGVQPIQPGGWNFQYLFAPFLFSKWFFIGYVISWAFGTYFNRADPKPERSISFLLLVIGTAPLALTWMDIRYATNAFSKDREYWENLFAAESPSEEMLQDAGNHLSSAGRERISWHLQYHMDDLRAPVVMKLRELGFGMLQSRHTPQQVIDAVISEARSEHEKNPWKTNFRNIGSLASNPAISGKTFQELASIGDYMVVNALIRNPSNDEARLEWLRTKIESRVAEGKPTNDAEKWEVDRLREKVAALDKWVQIRRKRNWRP